MVLKEGGIVQPQAETRQGWHGLFQTYDYIQLYCSSEAFEG